MARFSNIGGSGGGVELPQNLSTNASPTFDKVYTTHNSDGTNVKIGDDAWIGDIDIANHISIQGVEDDTKGGIVFGSNETELISSDGINLTLEADNDIILLPGSSYAYIGTPLEDGSNRIAKLSDITGGPGADIADFIFTNNEPDTTSSSITLPDDKEMRIEAGLDSDLLLKAGDRLYLTATGDDIQVRAGDDIRFTSNYNTEEGQEYYWRMDSEGRFQLPGPGYIENPENSSGDGYGYGTLKLVPDDNSSSDQYIIIDPTTPNHIHIRAGGVQDNSNAELILGGERAGIGISDNSGAVTIRAKKQDWSWSYQNINEAGDTTYIVNTEVAEPEVGDYTIVNGVKYTINSRTVIGQTTHYLAISNAGSYLQFNYNENYTFYRYQGEHGWYFGNDGVLYGPAMGGLVVNSLGGANNANLPIFASDKVYLNGTNGEFLKDPDIPGNQIATIGDISAVSPVKVRFSPVFQATGLTFTGTDTTYPTYNSWYVKYGDMVTFSIKCVMSTVTNFGTGQFKLELPVAPLSTAANHFSAWCWVDPSQPADELNGHVQLVADHLPNSQTLDLHWLKETTASPKPLIESILSQGTPITLTTSSVIYVNGTYIAA